MAEDRTVDKAKQAVEEGAAAADRAILTTADRLSRATENARVAAEDALDAGNDAIENALVCAKDIVRAHPLSSLAAVAAIAYLWGRIRS